MAEKQTNKGKRVQSKGQREVQFNYIKSNYFRVIHADGAWGGVSPKGDIHISFYNERAAIPDVSKIVVSTEGAGAIIKPEEFMAASELVREIEADVIVDLGTAIQLRSWLDHKIKGLQEMIRQAKKGTV